MTDSFIEKSFLLPDLGEGLADAELVRWHVAVGDTVTLNQVIAEVETAKAAVELPSPYAGRVLALRAVEGETVTVGTPIIVFAIEAPAGVGVGVGVGTEQPVAAEERVPVLVGYGATSGTSSRRNGRLRNGGAPPAPDVPAPDVPAPDVPAPDLPAPSPAATVAASVVPSEFRPLAKPLVRKLARELGVDLTEIQGTGSGGIVTRQDLLDHCAARAEAAAGPTVASPSAQSMDREQRIPVRGIRKATAQAMVRSAFTAPHVTEFITVDVTPTMELLRRLKGSAYLGGVKLTVMTFVASAMLQALQRHPDLNSSWDEDAQEIVLKRYVNLGIAAATPRGLLVPNVKNAHELDLIELARALEKLTATAREGRATPADLTGGTISLTNVGVFGVDTGTPIINPGEAAILCLGTVRDQPWVHEGALAIRSVTTLSLSFDHRLVDGEQGSRFLADIANTLATG
jgi:2-oxoisovalerate dehydrogenase E2 component (dihydrolipoyl transacylase)